MATACSLQQYGRPPPFINLHHKQQHSLSNCSSRIGVMVGNRSVMLQGFGNNNSSKAATAGMVVKCSGGYCILDLTACGLGDPETSLTEVHPVCPNGHFNIIPHDSSSFCC
ncbi:hypothetical protein NC653_041360 [Populus alba x Populus x berolinensis]|uniref:Uncharacterized protein n=1 Tax=Populus alba x Populus x berolinensis TaxID=444605 RepID=A0AAD6PQM9_9ROSI|nr:hypothetical protein NC653_041360 [Populus alba x Populus x berolinensis]